MDPFFFLIAFTVLTPATNHLAVMSYNAKHPDLNELNISLNNRESKARAKYMAKLLSTMGVTERQRRRKVGRKAPGRTLRRQGGGDEGARKRMGPPDRLEGHRGVDERRQAQGGASRRGVKAPWRQAGGF